MGGNRTFESLTSLPSNRALNRTRIRTRIGTRVDGPLTTCLYGISDS
jgi:hypothetical protein